MKLRKVKKQCGLTLIELLLYMSISMVMVLMISTASISMLRASHKTELLKDVAYSSAYILQTFTSLSSNAYRIENPSGVATTSSITFRMNEEGADPTIVYADDGVIYLKEGSGAAVPIHTDQINASVVFTNLTTDRSNYSAHVALEITAYTESILSSDRVTENFETTLMLNFTP